MNNEQLNNHLRTAGVLALTLLSVLLATKIVTEIKALPSVGDSPTDMSRVITVTGHSEVEAIPDVATFSWTVTENGATVQAAQDKAAEKSNNAVAYLKKNGVDAKDISNQSYSTNELYDYNAPCNVSVSASGDSKAIAPVPPVYNSCPKIIGYTTNQTVTVKLRGVKEGDNKIGELIAGVGQFGVKPGSAYFTFDDIDAVRQQARVEAVEKARAQAEEIASALGVKIKGVASFNESYGGYYPMAYGSARDAVMNQAKTPVIPEIPNGSQTVSADVTVSYSIR
ncbi:MAG: SIMPL domain-containing protein [Patescibacteria group bacterium]